MKMRIALASLFTLVCLALAALPATATTLFSTGLPQNNLVGTQEFKPFGAIAVSYVCSTPDCDVESISFWVHDHTGTVPVLGSLTWTLGPHPFLFSGPGVTQGSTSSFTNLGCMGSATSPVVQQCDFSFNLGQSVDVPFSVRNWLTISGMSVGAQVDTFWDGCSVNSASNCAASSGQTKNLITGMVTNSNVSQAFTISGTPTGVVPEPGSILMLGTGILGFAGVLRRKLKL